jgi:hypothetical protein
MLSNPFGAIEDTSLRIQSYYVEVIQNPDSSFEDVEIAIEGLAQAGKPSIVFFMLGSLTSSEDSKKISLYNKAAVGLKAANETEAAKTLWNFVLHSAAATNNQALRALRNLMQLNTFDLSDINLRSSLIKELQQPHSIESLLNLANQIYALCKFDDLAIQAYVRFIHQPTITSAHLKHAAIKLVEIAPRITIGENELQQYAFNAATRAINYFILHPQTTDEERREAETMKSGLHIVLLP